MNYSYAQFLASIVDLWNLNQTDLRQTKTAVNKIVGSNLLRLKSLNWPMIYFIYLHLFETPIYLS